MIHEQIYQLFKVVIKFLINHLRRLYSFIYKAFKLNILFYKLGLSLEMQARLLPVKTYKSNLITVPIYVNLQDIKWGGRDVPGRGFIFSGNWDEDKQPIKNYLNSYIYSKTVIQLFIEGRPYYETAQYQEMSNLVKMKKFKDPRTRKCKSEEDIKAYFVKLARIYDELKGSGYKTQGELTTGHIYDEIAVYVDRNGELQKRKGSGQHRLAMAYILNIQRLPVIAKGVHIMWVKECFYKYKKDIVTVINQGLEDLNIEKQRDSE